MKVERGSSAVITPIVIYRGSKVMIIETGPLAGPESSSAYI